MTLQTTKRKSSPGSRIRKAVRRLPLGALAILFLILFFLKNADLAKDAALSGLRRAGLSVLPAVFPFLVFSDLLLSTGGLPERMSRWLSPILRLPAATCTAVLLGWICGFPIGALCIAKEFERDHLNRADVERAVAAASVPSPAFLIGVVGTGVFQSPTAGILLWLFCILSAVIVCFFTGKSGPKTWKIPQNSNIPASVPFFKALTCAVRNAAGISLHLCAFVTFFAVLTEAAKSALGTLGIPATFSPLLAALLELASGIFSAPAVPVRFLLPFCAAACGWAGLSVHVQIFSVCEKLQMHCGKYLLAKGMQAALCFLFALIRQCFG